MIEPTPHTQKKKHSRQMATSCESCGNFVYDEEYECPYYQLGDEYRIVRKQM